jgi:protocatechuate 3,4-dioxygenase alpha subunit
MTLTPFQTVGPFFDFGLAYANGNRLARDGVAGRRIVIEGRVIDGAGEGLPDGLVEIWQADAHGRYRHPEDNRHAGADPAFDGFGRTPTGRDGSFRFDTIMPGRVPGPDDTLQASHVLLSLLARGVLTRYVTRIYFEDDPALTTDPILRLVPEARRSTLIATLVGEHTYRFDVVIQGPGETVFFDI